jgi:TetR/AcrR family transcriptional regulator, lmrAB and yxaGH operons repressor
MDTTPTRQRLIAAMCDQLERRGLHGVGLNELLAQAQAPKGVLYHHFPGGKTALAVAAIASISQRIGDSLDRLLVQQGDPVAALRTWMASAQRRLDASGFERGCPLATVALESSADDTLLRGALASAFAGIRGRIGAALIRAGIAEPQAKGLASLMVATYEGGLLQARVAGCGEPMAQAAQMLLDLLQTYLHPNDKP